MKQHNPWNGAAFYEEPMGKTDYQLLFCGRSHEIKTLQYMVRNNVYVTLYGKSGLGKTSLLKAGLFPQLRQVRYLPVYLRLGESQVQNLSQYVVEQVEQAVAGHQCTITRLPVLGDEPESDAVSYLWHYFACREFRQTDGKTIFPVVVFDQFEEFFRYDEAQTTVLMKQIGYMADGSHELSERRLPDGRRYVYAYNCRFIGAIREDELYRLEDCIDNNYLSCLKQNRMRLRGLSPEGAREVVTVPGRDCIDPAQLEQVADNIIKAAPNGDGTINSLMLSIICTNLYEQLQPGHLIDNQMTSSLDYTIETFFCQEIAKLPPSERPYVQSELINGPQRRPVPKDEFENRAPHALKLAPALFHLFPLPGSNMVHVELAHDRLAEVANKLQREKRESTAVLWGRIVIALMILAMAVIAIYTGQSTDDKNKAMTAYTEVRDHHFSTADTLWIDPDLDILEQNALVEVFDIEGKKRYSVDDCPYLSTINLSNIGVDTFCLTLQNLPMLTTIVMPDQLDYFKIYVYNCPRLTLPINRGLGYLDMENTYRDLPVRIASDVSRYVLSERILWDVDEHRVVTYDHKEYDSSPVRCFFPSQIKERTLKYGRMEFQNLQSEKKTDNGYSQSYHMDHTSTRINTQDIDPITKRLHLPDSVDFIPDRTCYQFHRLDSVKLPRRASVIGESAFEGCEKLRSVRLPDDLTVIGKRAFKDCKRLRHIVIPASVHYIDQEAFAGCDSLQTVVILSDSLSLYQRVFAFNHELRIVEWTPKKSEVWSFFANPFFDCPKLEALPTGFTVKEKPKIKDSSGDVEFYQDDYVYAKDFPAELHFPVGAGPWAWEFVGNTSGISDIYVLFAQPDFVSVPYNVKSDFKLILPDEHKSNITLHVPYGCRRYYEALPRFKGFKQIEEMSKTETRWLFLKSRFYYLWKMFCDKWYAHIPLFLFFVWIGFGVMRRKQKESKWTTLLPGAILYAVLVVITSVAFFFSFMYIDGWSPNISGLVGCVVGIAAVTAAFLARELRNWLLENKISKKIDNSAAWITDSIIKGIAFVCRKALCFWKWIVAAVAIAALAFGGVYYNKRIHNLQLALQEGNTARALSLLADQMVQADSLYDDDISLLHSLLVRSGVQPQFNEKETIADYKVLWSSSENDHCWIKRADTVSLWTDNGRRYDWVDRQHLFNPQANYRIFYYDKILSFYDTDSDKSALYFLDDADAQPLVVEGKIGDVRVEQDIYIAQKADRYIVSDRKGQSLSVPYFKYDMTHINGDGILCGDMLFAHCGDSLVAHRMGQGELKGFVGRRFVLWQDGLSGQKHFYDMANGFALCTDLDEFVDKYSYPNDFFVREEGKKQVLVKSADLKMFRYLFCDRLVFQMRHSIVYGEEGETHVFDTRQFKDYVISHQTPSWRNLYNCGICVQADRYLIFSDNSYDHTYVFDMENEYKLLGKLDGCKFTDHKMSSKLGYPMKTSYLWLDVQDSVQFYRLEDGRLLRGAKLPVEMAEQGKWTEGFVIADKDTQPKVYSMLDDGAAPISLPIQMPMNTAMAYLSGSTLLQFYDGMHIYSFDGLRELVRRSSLNQRQKEQLIQRLPADY